MEEHGADIKDTLTGFHAESITLTDRTRSQSRNIIIRDPAEIEEIMKHAVLDEYSDYNSFLAVDYNRELSVTFVNQGIVQEHRYLFIEGQVPDFIKQKIGD